MAGSCPHYTPWGTACCVSVCLPGLPSTHGVAPRTPPTLEGLCPSKLPVVFPHEKDARPDRRAFSKSAMGIGVVGTPRVSPDASHSPDHRPRETALIPQTPFSRAREKGAQRWVVGETEKTRIQTRYLASSLQAPCMPIWTLDFEKALGNGGGATEYHLARRVGLMYNVLAKTLFVSPSIWPRVVHICVLRFPYRTVPR